MNCQECEQIITGLAAGQLMDAGLRTRGLAHAAECPRCSRWWQDEPVLNVGLLAFAASTANAEAPARLKAALRAAFDEQAKAFAPPVVVPVSVRAQRWPRWAVAAAAAVLVTAGVTALVWLRGATPQPKPIIANTTASPTPVATTEPRITTPVLPLPNRDKLIAQHRAPKPVNKVKPLTPQPAQAPTRVAETEVAAQFIPLNYARNTSQEGLVVRVEVSRASLIAMGLPLDVSRAEGNVKADLKVGVDGVPLAIRLLQ